jgi:hypothetical protein
VGEHPTHDVPAVDVEDHAEVVVVPLGLPQELRDVPGPNLARSRGHEPRLGISGMTQLAAALPDPLIGPEDAIHRADSAEIGALIQEFRVGLGRDLAGEWLPPDADSS